MIFVWKVESVFFSIQFFFRDPKLGKSGSSGPGQFGDISPFQGHVGSTFVKGSRRFGNTPKSRFVSLVGFARTVLVSFVLETEICISFHQPRWRPATSGTDSDIRFWYNWNVLNINYFRIKLWNLIMNIQWIILIICSLIFIFFLVHAFIHFWMLWHVSHRETFGVDKPSAEQDCGLKVVPPAKSFALTFCYGLISIDQHLWVDDQFDIICWSYIWRFKRVAWSRYCGSHYRKNSLVFFSDLADHLAERTWEIEKCIEMCNLLSQGRRLRKRWPRQFCCTFPHNSCFLPMFLLVFYGILWHFLLSSLLENLGGSRLHSQQFWNWCDRLTQIVTVHQNMKQA